MIISSREILLPAWSLLLSQRQDFLNSHVVQVPNTPNQKGTMEMRDKILWSVGAQDMDTGGYQKSDLDDVEIYWEKDQLDENAVFRPGIDAPFSPSTFNNSEMDSLAENPILTEKEQDKENSPPLPTTPVSERPTLPLVLMTSCPYGTRIENVPDYV